VQPRRAAGVRARAGGRQCAVYQRRVHPDLLLRLAAALGSRERAAQADPLLARALVEGEALRRRGRRLRGGVGEEGDLGAEAAQEAVDEGGAAHVGDVGTRREEAQRGRGGEEKRVEVGAQAEQPPRERHGVALARRRRRRGILRGVWFGMNGMVRHGHTAQFWQARLVSGLVLKGWTRLARLMLSTR
jgi:hypothetical protein